MTLRCVNEGSSNLVLSLRLQRWLPGSVTASIAGRGSNIFSLSPQWFSNYGRLSIARRPCIRLFSGRGRGYPRRAQAPHVGLKNRLVVKWADTPDLGSWSIRSPLRSAVWAVEGRECCFWCHAATPSFLRSDIGIAPTDGKVIYKISKFR
jgi:hypothetical protein